MGVDVKAQSGAWKISSGFIKGERVKSAEEGHWVGNKLLPVKVAKVALQVVYRANYA